MAIIVRKRILRPLTRKPSSSYKINTENVFVKDMLSLTICHNDAKKTPLGVFEFRGSDIAGRKSIHFSTEKNGDVWEIKFIGANPFLLKI